MRKEQHLVQFACFFIYVFNPVFSDPLPIQ